MANQSAINPRVLDPVPEQPEHLVQLDGLRTLAILTVMCEHWLPLGHPLRVISAWGTIGVYLFFVLSGYLITGILLKCRDAVEGGRESLWFALRQFYARRFLRIFPAYYLALGLMVWLGLPGVREVWPWHFFYASNFYFAFGQGPGGPAGHFWTLSVEEQFYLMWPGLVLFLPRRWMLPAILLLIVSSPVGNAIASAYGFWGFSILTPGCIHFLGVGAFIAMCSPHSSIRPIRHKTLELILLVVSAPLLLGYIGLDLWTSLGKWALPLGQVGMAIYFAIRSMAIAMFFGWIVSRAASGFGWPIGSLLSFGPIVYLGRISYGLYLFHVPLLWIIPPILNSLAIFTHLKVLADPAWQVNFMVRFAGTVLISAVSWHFFEAPINGLKRHFPYVKRGARESRTLVSSQALLD